MRTPVVATLVLALAAPLAAAEDDYAGEFHLYGALLDEARENVEVAFELHHYGRYIDSMCWGRPTVAPVETGRLEIVTEPWSETRALTLMGWGAPVVGGAYVFRPEWPDHDMPFEIVDAGSLVSSATAHGQLTFGEGPLAGTWDFAATGVGLWAEAAEPPVGAAEC